MEGYAIQRIREHAQEVVKKAEIRGVFPFRWERGEGGSATLVGPKFDRGEIDMGSFNDPEAVADWIATATSAADRLAEDVVSLVAYVASVQADLIAAQRNNLYLMEKLDESSRYRVGPHSLAG